MWYGNIATLNLLIEAGRAAQTVWAGVRLTKKQERDGAVFTLFDFVCQSAEAAVAGF